MSATLRVVRHADAAAFLRRAEAWLLAAEAENNLILGVALRYRSSEARLPEPPYWATVEQSHDVVGCAFRTPPHQLGVSRMPLAAIAPLADDVHSLYSGLPGVGGPDAEAERFAEAWAARAAVRHEVRMRQRIHVLTAVKYPVDAPDGALRLVAEADLSLIREWLAGFVAETGMRQPADEFAERLVRGGKLYVWDDGAPRCMLAAARESPNGATVNAVYTPPAHRRRGYATAAVASLSARLLTSGKRFCCLYTDTANPTSNAVYRRVGYAPIRDDVDIDFVELP